MLDSLYHLRHHMRFRAPKLKLDIDSLCSHLDIAVAQDERHTAIYDVNLLHDVLTKMAHKYTIPYISGLSHPFTISPMLVNGVGATVCMQLSTYSLFDLCTTILEQYGDLGKESCHTYLASTNLKAAVPCVNLMLIAEHVEAAAKRHLHYLA